MAFRGIKPALKTIDGGLNGLPALPASVPDVMREEWETVAIDLRDRRLLTKSCLGALESYVVALWSCREATKAIEKHGLLVSSAHNMLKSNPASALLTKSQVIVARLAAELGITPASRSREGMGGDKPEADEDDALGL
ncbi:P27 family predicted phage terminase small subunit [Rhizobium sp. PP-CC-2G-626]|nr:P27 family predicted phage terminase small subunit [Rhizobium sp. PP-CC-2G-626]